MQYEDLETMTTGQLIELAETIRRLIRGREIETMQRYRQNWKQPRLVIKPRGRNEEKSR